MVYVIIFIFALLFLILKGTRMDTLSFVTLLLFYLYWCVQLILSQFRINGVYMPSALSTVCLLIGVICFTLGYYSITIRTSVVSKYKLNYVETLKNSVNNLVEKEWFIILLILCSGYILYLDVHFFDAIAMGAFIRVDGSSMAEYYGPTFAKVNTYFFSWYIPFLRPIFCYCLLFRRTWYVPLMALSLLGFEILSGGRVGLIRTFIPVILIWGLFRKQFSRKYILLLSLIVVGIYFGIIALTAFRLGTTDFGALVMDGQEYSNDAIVTYFVGPAVAFDQVINSNIIDVTGGYKMGLNVLWPVFFPIIVVFYLLGFTDYINGPAGSVSDYLQFHYLTIDPSTKWNALYTWNVDFFCDGGLIGIIFMNFLFGFLMRYCFKWLYVKGTVYNLILVSILFVIVMQAPLKLYGMFNFLPILIYCLLFAHTREAKRIYSFR